MIKREKINELLLYTENNVDFYKRYKGNIDYNAAGIAELLSVLPIVDKSIIKNDYIKFIDKNLLKYNIVDAFKMEQYGYEERMYEYPCGKIFVEYTSGTCKRQIDSNLRIRKAA